MRAVQYLVAAAALLAVYGQVAVADKAPAFEPRDAALARLSSRALTPVNKQTLEEIKQGLEAAQKFVEIFNSKIFEGTPVGMVAEIFSKSLSFITSFMDLFGGGQSESPEMQFMRKQFSEVHSKLDGIGLQIDDVKNLIEWSTTRGIYAQYELEINTATKLFDLYVKSTPLERDTRKRQFIDYYKYRRAAAFKLFQAIVETDYVVSKNLAKAVTHYTKNHRRKSTSFLLAMSRLVLRGAQMEIAYEQAAHSQASAGIIERDWQGRIVRMTNKMKQVEDEVKAKYATQVLSDVSAEIINKRGLSNKDFTLHLYNILAEKYDWRYWISLVFKKDAAYAVSHCGGGFFSNVAGDRSVAVASSDRKTTKFTKSFGDTILQRTHAKNLNTNSVVAWRDEINSQIGNTYCDTAALRAVVCWGCDVWFASISSRQSYRKITSGKHIVNALVFG